MSLNRFCALAALVLASHSLTACGDSDEEVPDTGSDIGTPDAADAGSDAEPDSTGPDATTDVGTDSGNPTDTDNGDTGITDSGNGDTGPIEDVQPDAPGDTVETDTTPADTVDGDTTDADTADAADTDTVDTDVIEPGGWFPDERWPAGVWTYGRGGKISIGEGVAFTGTGPDAFAGEVVSVNYDESWFVLEVSPDSGIITGGSFYRVNWLLSDTLSEPPTGYICFPEVPDTTQVAAETREGADPDNLITGCYGGAWLATTKEVVPPYVGNYQDAFGGFQELSNVGWRTSYDGVSFDAFTYVGWTSNAFIARNADANTFAPGLWSRFDIAVGTEVDQLWYCQSVFDGGSIFDAILAAEPDTSALETTGCAGFPWTPMLPQVD